MTQKKYVANICSYNR